MDIYTYSNEIWVVKKTDESNKFITEIIRKKLEKSIYTLCPCKIYKKKADLAQYSYNCMLHWGVFPPSKYYIVAFLVSFAVFVN